MENPYSIIKDSEHAPKDWYDPRYGAWEEGDANGDERGYARGKADRYEQIKRQRAELDSQKQIVSESMKACQFLVTELTNLLEGGPLQSQSSGVLSVLAKADKLARRAIATATGI